MALSRRGFFGGLVAAVGAIVGLKALPRDAVVMGDAVETEIGPFYRTLSEEKADLAAMAFDQRLMALQERAYRDFAEMDRAQAYRAYAYGNWTPAPPPPLPPPLEIRELLAYREDLTRQIREFYLTRLPPPMVFSRESLEAAGVRFLEHDETYAEYVARRAREEQYAAGLRLSRQDDPHAWQARADWMGP